jgi:hypothetical protein
MINGISNSGAGLPSSAFRKRKLCQCKLSSEIGDDLNALVCGSCKQRPEARRLGKGVGNAFGSARAFTDAERALISKLHGYMPAAQLLGILNERLMSDVGPDAMLYSMEQLYAEIGEAAAASGGTRDWPSLRKLLAQARRSGVLEAVSEQVNEVSRR